MELINSLWVEKYRPKELSDFWLEPSCKELISNFVSKGEIGHLLFWGQVGVGKTSLARFLLNKLDCEYIYLNASDERGIESVRNKIKLFCRSRCIRKWKIVVLDEADAMTSAAQFALRGIIEDYSFQNRFIFTANYYENIIEPIRSRCISIEFKPPDVRSVVQGCCKILESEGVRFELDDVFNVVERSFPDIRSIINELQCCNCSGNLMVKERGKEDIVTIMNFLLKGDIAKLNSVSSVNTFLYSEMFEYIEQKMELDFSIKAQMLVCLGEYMYRDSFVRNKKLNFLACCYQIWLILKK